MKENGVEQFAYIPELSESRILVTGAYKFNDKHGWHWLQRLCLWALDRLGCQYHRTEVTCYTVTIEFDNIIDLVLAQKHAVHDVFHGNCKYLVLGREQMFALQMASKIPEYQMLFSFPIGYKSERHKYRICMQFSGMNVILVPWFDGIVCLNELE